jgi:hypothetical protein
MIDELLSMLMADILSLLREEKGFFTMLKGKREALSANALPFKSFAQYLANTNEANFIEDLRLCFVVRKSGVTKTPGGLIMSLQRFFVEEFPERGDIPQTSRFCKTLQRAVSRFSSQEMTEEIQSFLERFFNAPRILVQSPISCDVKTQREIRQYFSKTHPESFPVFSINNQLIGGIRFFINGKVQDFTWFSKVQKIRNLAKYVTAI